MKEMADWITKCRKQQLFTIPASRPYSNWANLLDLVTRAANHLAYNLMVASDGKDSPPEEAKKARKVVRKWFDAIEGGPPLPRRALLYVDGLDEVFATADALRWIPSKGAPDNFFPSEDEVEARQQALRAAAKAIEKLTTSVETDGAYLPGWPYKWASSFDPSQVASEYNTLMVDFPELPKLYRDLTDAAEDESGDADASLNNTNSPPTEVPAATFDDLRGLAEGVRQVAKMAKMSIDGARRARNSPLAPYDDHDPEDLSVRTSMYDRSVCVGLVAWASGILKVMQAVGLPENPSPPANASDRHAISPVLNAVTNLQLSVDSLLAFIKEKIRPSWHTLTGGEGHSARNAAMNRLTTFFVVAVKRLADALANIPPTGAVPTTACACGRPAEWVRPGGSRPHGACGVQHARPV